jgi:16S rRNA (guanine966-N2)-methyltransferase
MRVTGGRWKGKTLYSPAGPVRPTAESLRDAWLTALGPDTKDASMLDLFAGSGALGIEALSRGARRVDFVENHPAALHALKANVAGLRMRDRTRIFKQDAIPFTRRLGSGSYDVVFADPPYGSRKADIIVECWLATGFSRILCVEHDVGHVLPGKGARAVTQGQQAVTFYRL